MSDSEEEPDCKEHVKRVHYILSFSYTFEYDNDVVFFSHFYPYSYADLKNTLVSCMNDSHAYKHLRVDSLCKTLAGKSMMEVDLI